MKKLICLAVIALILILAAATALAASPGKGEITVSPGGAITSLTVRYNLDSLMGEPLVTGAFKWDSATRSEIDYDTVCWLEIQDNVISSNRAFIMIGDGIPGKRGEWSFDGTGSNSWNTVLVQTWSGKNALKYVDAAIAKQYWKNGFKVIGAELSKKFEAIAPQAQKYNPPGRGQITVNPGGAITSLSVLYNIDVLMGEPTVSAAYKWESTSCREFDYDTVVWLKIQDKVNPANLAFIRLGDGVPGKRGRWSDDFTGSSKWDRVLVQAWNGPNAIEYVSPDIAKQYWINGFKVVGAEMSKKYDSKSQVDGSQNQYGIWSEWKTSDYSAMHYRIMCARYDDASRSYVWRIQVANKSDQRLSVTTSLYDYFNNRETTRNRAENIEPGATADFPEVYTWVGWRDPNGLPITMRYSDVEFTPIPRPQSKEDPHRGEFFLNVMH